jgi:hypothetical protein
MRWYALVLAFAQEGKLVFLSFMNVDPQSLGSHLFARHRKQNLNRNVMHDLNN